MFTAFMLALTLTSVAYVLVTMALGPVITALFSRIFLRHPAVVDLAGDCRRRLGRGGDVRRRER
jgi:hypothetical protein